MPKHTRAKRAENGFDMSGESVLELMGTGIPPRTIKEAHYLSKLTVDNIYERARKDAERIESGPVNIACGIFIVIVVSVFVTACIIWG